MSAQRRQLLHAGAAAALAGPLAVWVQPARATPEALQAAVRSFTGGRPVQAAGGRMQLEIAQLVDNGNAVPVAVRVDSPMSAAQHVRRIALFTERNPQPEVVVFHLGPRNGRAAVATRLRLATSQQVLALAELSDGSIWQQAAEVMVTLAACLE